MDEEMRLVATSLLEAAPASVELPAGTGKTQLLAASVAVASQGGARSLVLTHTNAGVDAIRKRLRSFGVPSTAARVETITSWAFSIVRAYSSLAGVAVPETPDWSASDSYVEGATRAIRSVAICLVHSASFEYLFVDEYQDCTLLQHEMVMALAAAVPKAIVLGDSLQAIFGFAGQLVDWERDVLGVFPPFRVDSTPHRWRGHNEPLGEWLLRLRPDLCEHNVIDFAGLRVPGLVVVSDASARGVAAVAHGFRNTEETVVLLDKWRQDVAGHASRLGGVYTVMEDINGNFMREQLEGSPHTGGLGLPANGDPLLAMWLAQFAKKCAIGLSQLDRPVLVRLEENRTLAGLSRSDIGEAITCLERLRVEPTYGELERSAKVIQGLRPQVRIYRWEAWIDTLKAIAMSAENGEPALENLGRVREQLRRHGRRAHARVASRTLLVKGLEFDHVIIANLHRFSDPRNLYVALSRARKSVTVIGHTSRVQLELDRPRR